MQGNSEGNQNTPGQAFQKEGAQNKFSCKICKFTCNSLQNFRIHLQDFKSHFQMAGHKGNNKGNQNTPGQAFWNRGGKNKSSWKKKNAFKKAGKGKSKAGQKGLQKGIATQQAKQQMKVAPDGPSRFQRWKADQQEKQKREVAQNNQSENVAGSSGRNISRLRDYIFRADREPLIGVEYVLEYRLRVFRDEVTYKYFCALCECDMDVDPMVEHLAGFGHRKLYLAKQYPYVLKALSNSKEDQYRFIRRMALEIEREEGTKKYMMHQTIFRQAMIILWTANKEIKRRTSCDDGKNAFTKEQTRLKKALNYLGTFEIESEIESTTVTRLCETLTDNLKLHNRRQEYPFFPDKPAKAERVERSMMRHAAREQTRLQNPIQKKEITNSPPQFNKRQAPENANVRHKDGMQSGYRGENYQNRNAKQNMPKTPANMQGKKYIPRPSRKKEADLSPSMPRTKENPQKAEKNDSDKTLLKNMSQEDTQFFTKLMALLEGLPQSSSAPKATEMDSKLLMLKSLMAKEKNTEHEQANQKMMMQIASMVQNTISAQNASLNQQLMMLMTPQSSPAMVMQTSSLTNHVLATGGFVPGIQSLGAVNSLMPFNQRFVGNAARPPGQNAYQVPPPAFPVPPPAFTAPPPAFTAPPPAFPAPPPALPAPPQSYGNFGNESMVGQTYGQMEGNTSRQPGQNTQVPMHAVPDVPQAVPNASQSYDHFGYEDSVAGNYLPQGNPNARQHDSNGKPLTTRQNEQKRVPYSDVGYESSASGKEWDNTYGNSSTQMSESRYADRSGGNAAYSRVSLSPRSVMNQYDDDDIRGESRTQDQRCRPSIRSYNSPDWDDQEGNKRYNKRPRLDSDNRSDRSESYRNQSLESLGINIADLPEEILRRLQGKDLFTASAIISEYSESRSGK